MLRAVSASVAILILTSAASAEQAEQRDWAKLLAEDAQALHDNIAANHPGSVNALDPGFAANNDRQLAIALDRAKTAKTYADYFFPLRIYVSSFNDAHMGFGASGATPNDFRWPGFATQYDGSDSIVVATNEPNAPVPKGARLVACDGMSAARYAEATVGKMWGNWSLESQHKARGFHLFLDESSGLIPIAKRCTFRVGKTTKTVDLMWRPLSFDRMAVLAGGLMRGTPGKFAARSLADGTRWVAIPSFDGNPQSEAVKLLPGMIETLRKDRTALAAAPAIVLDLRGNGGGTSDWSRQMALALWGQKAIDALPPGPDVQVDWRASPANLAEVATGYAERRNAAGFSTEIDGWYRSVIAGLGVAIARKQPLWRHVEFDAAAGQAGGPATAGKPGPAPLSKLSGPVYVLTDSSCMSACLDAVDLWTALGAVQIGRATGADTLYMEVRQYRLPSRITGGSMPMKVYRGRPRGSNEPAIPVHRFVGDIGNTKALEQWVGTLPERRPRTSPGLASGS